MNLKQIVVCVISMFALNTLAEAADPASVNGKPIKKAWLDYIVKDAEARGQKANDNMIKLIINELVGSELAYQEAQKQGMDKNPDFIINEELARRKLLVNAYLAEFIKKNPVSEAEKKEAYEQYKKELGDKEYSARHILLKTESEANDVAAQLKKGTDFAKLAKEKSGDPGSKEKGGDLGWFSLGGMVKPFAEAVAGMKKSEVSAPVQSQFGWHVIKLVDTRALKPPPYKEVEEGLERSLQQRKLEKHMLSLKDKSKIEVLETK